MTFYDWLMAQRLRVDDVGRLALLAQTDKRFPRRSSRLYLILAWSEPQRPLRQAVKKAHREWRAAA